MTGQSCTALRNCGCQTLWWNSGENHKAEVSGWLNKKRKKVRKERKKKKKEEEESVLHQIRRSRVAVAPNLSWSPRLHRGTPIWHEHRVSPPAGPTPGLSRPHLRKSIPGFLERVVQAPIPSRYVPCETHGSTNQSMILEDFFEKGNVRQCSLMLSLIFHVPDHY